MNHNRDVPPQDVQVLDALRRNGSMTAGELVQFFMREGDHPRRDIQRAIQRCLDRGSIGLGDDLELVALRAFA